MRGFLLGAATVLLAQLFTLGGEYLRRRWARQDQQKGERMELGRSSAEKILDYLDEARKIFDTNELSSEAQQRIYDLCHSIDREATLLPDATLRNRMDELSSALWHADVPTLLGDSHRRVAFLSYKAGIEALGAFRRGEWHASFETTSMRTVSEYAANIEAAYYGADHNA